MFDKHKANRDYKRREKERKREERAKKDCEYIIDSFLNKNKDVKEYMDKAKKINAQINGFDYSVSLQRHILEEKVFDYKYSGEQRRDFYECDRIKEDEKRNYKIYQDRIDLVSDLVRDFKEKLNYSDYEFSRVFCEAEKIIEKYGKCEENENNTIKHLFDLRDRFNYAIDLFNQVFDYRMKLIMEKPEILYVSEADIDYHVSCRIGPTKEQYFLRKVEEKM